MSWLRLWDDLPTDPKFRTISRLSRQPLSVVISVYIFYLVDASKNRPRGTLNCEHEDVASALDLEIEVVELIRKTMEGRLILNNYLTGWEKRQMEKEDASKEGSKPVKQRVKEYRERQKVMVECNENVTDVTTCNDLKRLVTTCNAPDTDTDTDTDTEKKEDMSGKPDPAPKFLKNQELKKQAVEILDFLNLMANRKYRPVKTNLKLIMARLSSGADFQDCKSMIARKVSQWGKDSKMVDYLRPKTLFNETNFEQYIGELVEEYYDAPES